MRAAFREEFADITFGDAVNSAKLNPFQFSLFDKLQNGEGMHLENGGNLLSGKKLFDH